MIPIVEPDSSISFKVLGLVPLQTRPYRFASSAIFIGIWMALGLVFHPDVNTYLLIGVPLTLVFQLVVKREPLAALWVRSAPKMQLNAKLLLAITLLLVEPLHTLFKQYLHHAPAPYIHWDIACLAGVFAAAYAIQNFDRSTLKATLRCLLTAGLPYVVIVVLIHTASHKELGHSPILTGFKWLLLYFPVCFALEEVTFRGAIDSFVQFGNERYPWLSAFFVSALWGLWHVPTVPNPSISTAIGAVFISCIIGVPLSFAWRRSGNLASSGFVHSLMDAIRNVGILS